VAVFGKRRTPAVASIESEHDRIRAIRIAAADELGRLRTELAERVASVEAKERELADAIAALSREGKQVPAGAESAIAHAQVGLAGRAQELNRREAALDARERALVQEEAELARRAGAPDAERRLAQIETRLAELQAAEKAFARTQAELAERSDELARREAALLERRRGHAKSGGYDSALDRAALDEFDERLRRLERETRDAAESTFDSGLRTLEQRGAGGPPPTP
jgi:DNA repair exonuclease SbcCD ATPase subunit